MFTRRLKYFMLVAVMTVAVTPVASAVSVYGDAGVTLLNYKSVSQDGYLNPIGFGLGLGASVDVFPFVDVDAHVSRYSFKNAHVKSVIEKVIEDEVPERVRNNLDMPAILNKTATLSSAELSLVVTPPLILIRPYAGLGLRYSSLSMHQDGSDTIKDTAITPVLKVGARMNILLVFVGAEYKVSAEKFEGNFKFRPGDNQNIQFAPQTISFMAGIAL